eukprot:CAMPEP_0195149924 /NCGR_PEP_ID=MMETSP0448-20130528/177940_1 /TAXON_ID=66468 /ORGANISM="Heterocapsa triquestra, Strain CCMP 448" /LENGTH=69 /DNA_ID=CAMNT_0040188589 /DNA_START=290 /DNA_END=496 /DNA_ORIENTATION=-
MKATKTASTSPAITGLGVMCASTSTPPSKLCSQEKPTRVPADLMTLKTIRSPALPPVNPKSEIMSRQRI